MSLKSLLNVAAKFAMISSLNLKSENTGFCQVYWMRRDRTDDIEFVLEKLTTKEGETVLHVW